VLADNDTVDLTNLQRQILHRTDSIGMQKAVSGQRTLGQINPECRVIALTERLTGTRLDEEVAQADIVLDCCDNFATRHAVNRACVKLKKPLVSGAAIRFDGQIAVFDSRVADAPCYHCLFPEGQDVDEVRCAVMGVFAPLTGIIGATQAAEALKLLAGCGTSLAGRLLLLDGLGMEWREIRVPKDPRCAVCGEKA
jgi:adenylyltransferase/sulfurtransferase